MESASQNTAMETDAVAVRQPRRIHFAWAWEALLRPRRLFDRLTGERRGVWQAAILVLTATALLRVIVTGAVQQAGGAGAVALPPDFEYYTPEQQAQFTQAAQLTSGPVFAFIFPAILAMLGVWGGWLIVGGALHLTTTLLGGRSSSMLTMNVAAWARLPFALRDLVRTVAVLAGRQSISAPGLSGFIAPEATGFLLFLRFALAAVDAYLIWQIALLVTGIRHGDSSLPLARTAISVTLVVVVLVLLGALVSFGGAQLGQLTFVRPFFF